MAKISVTEKSRRIVAAAEKLGDEQPNFSFDQREAIGVRNSLYGLPVRLRARLFDLIAKED